MKAVVKEEPNPKNSRMRGMLVKIIDAEVFAVVVVVKKMPLVQGGPQETLATINILPTTKICPRL